MGGQSVGSSGGDAIDPMVQSLMEMGFKRGQCEKAVNVTNNRGVEPAMEWILANPDDDGSVPAAPPASGGGGGGGGGGSGIPDAATLPSIKTAKDGYKDGEISMFRKDGKAFAYKWSARNDMWEEVGEVAGTAPGKALGGTPGSLGGGATSEEAGEGGEPVAAAAEAEAKPELSMEERKAAMEARILKAKADKKKAADAEAKEMEKKRRAMGKESVEAKEAREKLIREREIAERKREKEADKEYKKKLQAKIAAEKEARKRKAEGLPAEEAVPAAPAAPKPTVAKKEHTTCTLMVKTLDGGSEKIAFKPEDTIGTVHNHVGMLHMRGEQGGWALASMFPRELYTPDKHGMTLKEAGLVPKAQLVITKT